MIDERPRIGPGWQRVLLFVGLGAAALMLWTSFVEGIHVQPVERATRLRAPRLLTPEGETVTFEHWRGSIVVVNLWASWCGPCRTEMPRLNRVGRDYRERGVEVIGLNVEGLTPRALADAIRRLDVEFPTMVPLDLLGGTDLAGEGVVPHTWLVDRRGRLRASHAGIVSERSLRRAVESLLDEPQPPPGEAPDSEATRNDTDPSSGA